MRDNKRDEERRARLAHLVILVALQSVMAAELILLTIEQRTPPLAVALRE